MPRCSQANEAFPGINSVPWAAWYRIWHQKGKELAGLAGSNGDLLCALLCLAGHDSPTASLSIQEWSADIEYVRRTLTLTMAESVFEVGCGAGAFLYGLQRYCRTVGGLDYSRPLLDIARKLLKTNDLITAEAILLPRSPKYDHVVSHGVFHYFPDEAYAARVVRRMAAKAVRSVAVLDVNDAAQRDEAQELRRIAYAESGRPNEELSQLFLHREFFRKLADELNCHIRIDKSILRKAISGRFRYNAFLFK
jgi:ubiquinone/menaquinone biosynthesis C-methylase UbiE